MQETQRCEYCFSDLVLGLAETRTADSVSQVADPRARSARIHFDGSKFGFVRVGPALLGGACLELTRPYQWNLANRR